MKALVTGGSGFVGSHLIETLVARGVAVRALARSADARARVEALGAEPRPGDLERPDSLAPACAGCDVVFHAAARVDIAGRYEEFHRVTVAGTEALVSAARAGGARRFVYVGSCAVYHPDQFRAGVIRESTPLRRPPRWSRYGRAKLAAERIVQARVRPPAEWTLLRLPYVYGPRNRSLRQYFYPLLQNRWMRLIGDGENELALLHVRDAARAVAAAGEVPAAAGRVLIAAAAERVTQRQFFDALADAFGLPRLRRRIPYGPAFALATLAEGLASLTSMAGLADGPAFRPLGGALSRNGVALTGLPQRLDGAATQALLNWRPEIGFADGMRETAAWFQAVEKRR